jgi:glutamine synthetase
MAVKDALDLVKKNKVEIVDFKFVDVPGLWQHFSVPAAELTADLFEEGIGFDGSRPSRPSRLIRISTSLSPKRRPK